MTYPPANHDLARCLPCLLSLVVTLAMLSTASGVEPVTAVVVQAPGQVVTGSQRGVEVVQGTGRLDQVQPADLPHIHDLLWSPSGDQLLVAGGSPAEAGVVQAFGWPSGVAGTRWVGHRDVVYRVAWLPDQQRLATASADGTARLWDGRSGKELLQYSGHSGPVTAMAVLRDPAWMITGGTEGTIHCWEPSTGTLRRTLTNHVGPILDLATSEQVMTGQVWLASASEDRTVRFWLPASGRLLRFVRLPAVPHAIAWSADGQQLYAGCRDGCVRVIDPLTASVALEQQVGDGRILCLASPTATSLVVGGEFGWLSVPIVPRHKD